MIKGCINCRSHDLRSRHHAGADGLVGKVEDVVEELALARLEVPALVAQIDELPSSSSV